MLSYIFLFLDLKHVGSVVSRVNKQFKRSSEQNPIWLHLYQKKFGKFHYKIELNLNYKFYYKTVLALRKKLYQSKNNYLAWNNTNISPERPSI
jgi:hypothetical protein